MSSLVMGGGGGGGGGGGRAGNKRSRTFSSVGWIEEVASIMLSKRLMERAEQYLVLGKKTFRLFGWKALVSSSPNLGTPITKNRNTSGLGMGLVVES